MGYNNLRHRVWGLAAVLIMALATITPALATTLQEEIDLGTKIDVEVLKENPLSQDQAAQKEIDRLGQLIVKNGGLRRPEIKYHFKVITGDDLNAFSIPGGYVYFTEHMWNVLRTDERAGVLAHEIVHSDRRHALDAMSKLNRRAGILGALLIITGANRTIGDIVSMANQVYTLKYSRGDEQQADEVGTDLLKASQLNPAGLLLAMRKIGRFQAEAGGQPPTILSTHPATADRLAYLGNYLAKMNVPVPPENIASNDTPDRIGTVIALSGDSVEFSSSKPLKQGDVVWLMTKGWDYYYESYSSVPSGRVVVTTATSPVKGKYYPIDAQKAKEIGRGIDVCAPPAPAAPARVATINAGVLTPAPGYTPRKLDRLVAMDTVWDAKAAKLISDATAYVVVTDPAARPGYVSTTRAKYAYAPISASSSLIKVSDPSADRWAGTVISIGKSSKQVEVLPSRPLDTAKTYEVCLPAWDKSADYAQRVVGTAKLTRTDKKIVMSIINFSAGWGIADISNGYDIYEQAPVAK